MRVSTAQQMADYFAKQVMLGRGQWTVHLKDGEGNVVTPPAGKSFDEATKAIYVVIRTKGVHSNGNS